jgi:ammonium transporter, Amt family
MNARQQRILIVDDNPVNISVLGNALMTDFEVMAATSGLEALRIVASPNRPDLILLDIMMPDMDGYEVCKRVRTMAENRLIPIVFVSAKDETEDEMVGLNLGAVDYIRKPINLQIALTRIRTQLELKSHRDRLTHQLQLSERDREQHQKQFLQLFNHSPQAIAFLDHKGRILDVNPGFESLFGYCRTDIVSKPIAAMIVPSEGSEESRQFFDQLLEGSHRRIETVRHTSEGDAVPVSITGYPVPADAGFSGVFVIYEDISERKAYEDRLRHQAFHDGLTGIPNRVLLNERTERSLARAKRSPYRFALLLMDLDRFKNVNDSLGHQAGDHILKTVSERLKACIREVDTAARLGGDEFAVLIEDYKETEEVTMIVQRIQDSIAAPIPVCGETVHISSSIGVVIETRPYEKVEDIFRDADLAMYHAKGKGKATYAFFETGMHQQALVSRKLESDLRLAVDNQEFELHYQPIIRVDTEELAGFEALIRWQHPRYGMISPDRFIPMAEETGLIIPIGQWVFKEAVRQLQEWRISGLIQPSITMNINISARQFLQADLVESIKHVLTEQQVESSAIKLELTESLLMEHPAQAVRKIQQLKQLGLQFVIDDFGTGYSSLSYIHRFPVDALKIDRSFIKNLERGPENLEIIKTIHALASALGLTVVAEGVETDLQLRMLKDMTCNSAQGYRFSKPLAREQVEPYLSERCAGA